MEVKSCFVNAASRRGGTVRGVRVEFSARRRRTVVVLTFTFDSVVGVVDGVVEGEWGSARRRDLEDSSRSGFMERAWRFR